MVADRVVVGVFDDFSPVARTRDCDLDTFGNTRVRSVCHQQDAVGQQDRLVDIVRDHEHGLMRGGADFHQFFLNVATSQRIERAERFIHVEHAGIGGEWDEGMLAAVLADVQRALPTAFDELQLGDLILPDIALENGGLPDLPDAAPEASGVTFALTAEQREIVDAALSAAGSDKSTAGRAAALTEVCRAFCP